MLPAVLSAGMFCNRGVGMKRVFSFLVAVAFLASVSSCAGVPGVDYTVDSDPIEQQRKASKQTVDEDDEFQRKPSWWERSWPYVLGSIVIIAGVAAVIAGYRKQNPVGEAEE